MVTENEIAAVAKAPRVTPDEVQANIKSRHFFTAYEGVLGSNYGTSFSEGDSSKVGTEGSEATRKVPDELRLLTICVLVLQNGYTVHGISACASKENYNQRIGENLAFEHAVNQIWPLMGYALRQKLHNSEETE